MTRTTQLPGVFGQFIQGSKLLPTQFFADSGHGNVEVYDPGEPENLCYKEWYNVEPNDYWRPDRCVDPRPAVLETPHDAAVLETPHDAAVLETSYDTVLICLLKRSGDHQHHGGQWFANGSSCETPEQILSDFEAQGDRPSEIRWIKVNIPKDSVSTFTLTL